MKRKAHIYAQIFQILTLLKIYTTRATIKYIGQHMTGTETQMAPAFGTNPKVGSSSPPDRDIFLNIEAFTRASAREQNWLILLPAHRQHFNW